VGKPLRPENIFFVQALHETRDAKVMRRPSLNFAF